MLDENIRIWGAGGAIGVKPPPRKYSSLETLLLFAINFFANNFCLLFKLQ